jgi:hypothetical protein
VFELDVLVELDEVADRLLVLGEELDEARDAALAVEQALLAGAQVLEGDLDAGVQVAELAQAVGEDLEVDLGGREDQGIGVEGDPGAAALAGAEQLDGGDRVAALEADGVGFALAPDVEEAASRSAR